MDTSISMERVSDQLVEERHRHLRELAAAYQGLDHQHYEKAKRDKLQDSVRAAAKEDDVDRLMNGLASCCNMQRLPLPVVLEQQTLTGDMLLHVAASSAGDGVLRLIMDHFSDQQVMARNRWGDTALHVAARSGNLGAAKLLVQRARWTRESKDHDWVLLWTKNNTGNTPLHEAVLNRKERVVEFLLEEDEKTLFWQNKQGKSALYLAVETGDLGILNLLLAINLEEEEDFASKVGGMSPVHAAITSQRIDMIKAMQARKPNLFQAKESGGYNALHLAVFTNYTEGVQLLLQQFPSLAFEYDEDGYLPIHVACKHSRGDIIQQWLEDCDNPGDFLTKEGQNIIHVAAKYGRNVHLNRMLRYPKLNPLINQQDDRGNTALHLAVAYLQTSTILYLVRDPSVKIAQLNNECQAPMDVLRMQKLKESCTRRQWMSYKVLACAGALGSTDLVVRPCDQKRKSWFGTIRPRMTALQLKENINTQLIVATLIATVTFAAGFTVPGGFYGSDSSNKGLALLSGQSMFNAFIISNTIAMYCSLLAIVFWSLSSYGDPDSYLMSYIESIVPLRVAILAMAVAFMTGVYPILEKHHQIQHGVLAIGIIFIYFICGYTLVLIQPKGCKSSLLRGFTFMWLKIGILISGSQLPSPILEKEEEERGLSKGYPPKSSSYAHC